MRKGNRTFSLMFCQDSFNLSWLTLCWTFILPNFSIIVLKFASLQFEALFTQFVFYDQWFSHTILYIHKLSRTARILSLGSLWIPLCWHGTLLEKSMSRACVGAILLTRGVVSSVLAAVTVFESTWGIWVFVNKVRSWGQMGPTKEYPEGPGVTFSACLGQPWDISASWTLFKLDVWSDFLRKRTHQLFAWIRAQPLSRLIQQL